MKLSKLRDAIIPAISAYSGHPVIMADDMGDKPTGPHATYKFITPYAKGVGQPEQEVVEVNGVTFLRTIDEYKTTISISSYAMDEDDSLELAQSIYDWFAFDGVEKLQQLGIAVVEQTAIANRDAFVIENYERRNGFDVILRIKRLKDLPISTIEHVEINGVWYSKYGEE
ncbi:hypothetical protein NYE67_20470 [Solibacillus sp. FSL W8-0474]|uniref:phage neck terminator protein n=1 Tax=Solibacillus sp. FSL W8-0474 TaxID=2975336 RepID=UPI0030F95485